MSALVPAVDPPLRRAAASSAAGSRPSSSSRRSRAQADPRERLGQTLVRLGLLTRKRRRRSARRAVRAAGRGRRDGSRRPTPTRCAWSPSTSRARPACSRCGATDDTLEVAVGDPLDVVSLDHLRALTGCALKVWIARPSEVREAVDEFYQQIRATEKVGEILDKLDLTRAATTSRKSTSRPCASRSRTRRSCGS